MTEMARDLSRATEVSSPDHPVVKDGILKGALPIEIIDEIVRFVLRLPQLVEYGLGPSSLAQVTLNSISQATRTFRAVAQPLLFRRIIFNRPISELVARAQGLKELLDARGESAGWIKEFTFDPARDWRSDDPLNEERLSTLLPELFNRMDSLTTIAFWRTTLNPGMHEHIRRLRSLQTLSLRRVELPRSPSLPVGLDGGLSIRDLALDPSYDATGAALDLIQYSRLESLRWFGVEEHFLTRLFARFPINGLQAITELAIPSFSLTIPTFLLVITHFPNLTALTLGAANRVVGDPTWPPEIGQDVLSHLRKLSGAQPFVRLLAPGRPIEDVTYRENWHNIVQTEALHPLALSTVPLKRLDVRLFKWHEGADKVLGDLFPHLQSLRLRSVIGSNLLHARLKSHLTEVIGRFKQLEAITLDHPTDLPKHPKDIPIFLLGQRGAIEEASRAHPALRIVGFEVGWQWERDPDTGRWDAVQAPQPS